MLQQVFLSLLVSLLMLATVWLYQRSMSQHGPFPCAGYIAHPFSKETVFTLAFRRCDPSFPAFLSGSRSLQEGQGCPDHDGLSVCSPSAIRLLSKCDPSSPAMLLGTSEAMFPCAGDSTFNIHS